MDCSSIIRLEDLPVEVLMEIFIYFTAAEIYFSLSQLNHRLNIILKSLPNLVLVVQKHLDPCVLSFFYSFYKILIKFRSSWWCKCQSHAINGGNLLFEIYPASDNELYYYSSLNKTIENFIRPDICSQLQSLVLPATSPELTQLVFRGEIPRLRICHLGICKPIILPLSMTIQLQNFRQLTIREQNGHELEKILLICSSLVYLDFSCVNVIPPFIFINRCFPSMKCLRLGRLEDFFFTMG